MMFTDDKEPLRRFILCILLAHDGRMLALNFAGFNCALISEDRGGGRARSGVIGGSASRT